MAHMQCDLLEERWSARSAAIELASPAVGTADSDRADFVGKIGRRLRLTRSGMEAATGGEVISLTEAISTATRSAESAIANGLCDSAMEADTVSDPHPTPFEALDDQERQDKIDTAVASMAPDVRAAWNGLAHDGISWSELGRREGISDNGARKRYKPKFLDAFLPVGLDEYYGGAGTAGFDRADCVGYNKAGFASSGSATAHGLCDSSITAGCTGRPCRLWEK
jgi:hypothetical protein